MSSWCEADAFSGYVAAMVCRRVQVERPSWSTSGGQSEGISVGSGVGRDVVAGVGSVVEVDEEVEGEVCDCCFVRARHEAIDVQVRQLRG
jgi:hypothetical protein